MSVAKSVEKIMCIGPDASLGACVIWTRCAALFGWFALSRRIIPTRIMALQMHVGQ